MDQPAFSKAERGGFIDLGSKLSTAEKFQTFRREKVEGFKDPNGNNHELWSIDPPE